MQFTTPGGMTVQTEPQPNSWQVPLLQCRMHHAGTTIRYIEAAPGQDRGTWRVGGTEHWGPLDFPTLEAALRATEQQLQVLLNPELRPSSRLQHIARQHARTSLHQLQEPAQPPR